MHGAWHGGWCWRRVAERLRAARQRVFTPTLTGLGERRHLLSREVNLETHFRDVVELAEAEELRDLVLVGHSYGGIVITGVAARMRERIRQLVYLDAVLVEDGSSWSAAMPPEIAAARRKAAAESSGGVSLPVPKAEVFGVTAAADQAWVERRMTPHPFATFDQKLSWGGPIGSGLPRLYIDCIDPDMPSLAPTKQRVRNDPAWPVAKLQTGHDAMVSAPAALSEMLLEFA